MIAKLKIKVYFTVVSASQVSMHTHLFLITVVKIFAGMFCCSDDLGLRKEVRSNLVGSH